MARAPEQVSLPMRNIGVVGTSFVVRGVHASLRPQVVSLVVSLQLSVVEPGWAQRVAILFYSNVEEVETCSSLWYAMCTLCCCRRASSIAEFSPLQSERVDYVIA